MRQKNGTAMIHKRRTLAIVLLATSMTMIAQQQPPAVPHASTSRVQVTPRQGASPYGNAPNPAVGVQRAQGTITGYVYWQMNVFQPSSTCQGLSLKAITVDKVGMPLQLLSTTNTLTPAGPLTDTSSSGTPKYMLCSYAFQNMPENVALRVLLYGAPSSVSVSMPSSFQIPGGNCNSTPSSTLSFILTGGEMLCGNGAFNVNFKLTSTGGTPPRTTEHLLSGTPKPPGLLSNPGSAPNAPNQGSLPESSSGGVTDPSRQAITDITNHPRPTNPNPNVLTNENVIQMVRARIPDSVIVSSIQSSTKQFDFSPAAIEALQQAHVSPAVVAAMCDGSARCPAQGDSTPAGPGNKVELNPQPLPPRISGTRPSSPSAANGFSGGVKPAASNNSAQQIQLNQAPPAALGSASWSRVSPETPNAYVPKMPPMSSNAKRDAAPTADAAERSQIKAKVKAQLAAASQRTGPSANRAIKPAESNVPEIQALQQQITFANSLRTQDTTLNGTLLAAKTPNQVRMQPPQSSNPLAHAPAPTKFCPAPEIRAVNGKSSGVVFTQDPAYNDYIISGCGFGTQEGQVYLSGAVSNGRINLVVKSGHWSDTQIEASVQAGLTGVLDGWPDLIVAPMPAGSATAKFPNSRFYAQRQSVLLPNIPQQYASLANAPVGDGSQGTGTMYCPGPDLTNLFPCIAFNAGYKLDGFTNGVDYRNDPNSYPVSSAVDRNGNQHQFNSGQDTYDLSYMAPGFQIDYASVFWYAWTHDVCEGWSSGGSLKPGDSVAYETLGHYGWQSKTKTKIIVDWGVDHCAWRWLGMFRVDDWYNSGYSLQVYVKGPIGVDPWTGHPVKTARNFGQAQPNAVVRVP